MLLKIFSAGLGIALPVLIIRVLSMKIEDIHVIFIFHTLYLPSYGSLLIYHYSELHFLHIWKRSGNIPITN